MNELRSISNEARVHHLLSKLEQHGKKLKTKLEKTKEKKLKVKYDGQANH